MPVEWRKIPDAQIFPDPPIKIRWIIFVAFCVLISFVLTLALWPKDTPTNTLWFWMCAFLLPIGIGLICTAVRLKYYEQRYDRVSYWNQLRQTKKDEMIKFGQHAIGLMGMSYVTPVANNKLSSALLQGATSLKSVYPAYSSSIISMAQIQPSSMTFDAEEYAIRLEEHLKSVLAMLEPELNQYADDSLTVRIRHDQTLDDTQFMNLWRRVFPKCYQAARVTFGQQDDGIMWLDNWLDELNTSLVLSLEVNLCGEGKNHQAESVSALLLASPTWLSRKTLIPNAWIHRPVIVNDAKEALEDVVLWGRLSTEDKYFIWRSQLPVAPQTEMLQAMDALNFSFDKDNEHQLDSTYGMPAAAVGHIALVCACEHAISQQQPQWLMLQDKTPQWAIVRSV